MQINSTSVQQYYSFSDKLKTISWLAIISYPDLTLFNTGRGRSGHEIRLASNFDRLSGRLSNK